MNRLDTLKGLLGRGRGGSWGQSASHYMLVMHCFDVIKKCKEQNLQLCGE